MGIGTLRRYHEEAPGAEQSAPEAAVEAEADEAAAHEAKAELDAERESALAEAHAAGVQAGREAAAEEYRQAQIEAEESNFAREQAEQAERARLAAVEGETPESVNDVIVEAGAPVEPTHEGREIPNRGSSRALWVEYAESDPETVKGWTDGLSRDDLATHYLGAKPE